jgi:hypothetical protein
MRSSLGPSQYIASLCFQAESVLLWRDKGMPKGWLYNWKGIATMESKTQRHVFVKSLLVLYLCTRLRLRLE